MPIVNIVEGNLIERAEEGHYCAIVQGCNVFITQGSGLAGQLRKYPEVYMADQAYGRNGDPLKLGTYSYAEIETSEAQFTVINAYTQYDYGNGQDVEYLAIAEVFKSINDSIALNGCSTDNCLVGIPQIGAGLAGGRWSVIQKIINEVTPDIEIELVNFKL